MAVYPKGVKVFNPHAKAPSYVKGSIIITPQTLVEWMEQNPELVTTYEGQPQIKLSLMEGDNGIYLTVDTYQK
jgi:hypothetical protein